MQHDATNALGSGQTHRPVSRWRVRDAAISAEQATLDEVAVEEPLEIRVNGRGYAVTMRTPGHDEQLAVGFLVSEGLLSRRSELVDVDPVRDEPGVIDVALTGVGALVASDRRRHVYTTSSCGVCGLASIDAVATTSRFEVADDPIVLNAATVASWPGLLRSQQRIFSATGGVHAAGLIAPESGLVSVYEDVGRHNAVDKVIGAALLNDALPLVGHAIQVSGRASFELVQKAAMAGIGVLSAVSAPSSLAVDLASSLGLTLIGFSRDDAFNIYCGQHRLAGSDSGSTA